jgi:hypothetical protein
MKGDQDKRSARWDEGLKTAGSSGEDEPQANRDPHGGELGGSPEGMSHEEVDLRAEISAYLDRSIFPAKRDDVIHAAASKKASDQIMALLDRLPADVEFHNLGEVWRHLPGGAQATSS